MKKLFTYFFLTFGHNKKILYIQANMKSKLQRLKGNKHHHHHRQHLHVHLCVMDGKLAAKEVRG